MIVSTSLNRSRSTDSASVSSRCGNSRPLARLIAAPSCRHGPWRSGRAAAPGPGRRRPARSPRRRPMHDAGAQQPVEQVDEGDLPRRGRRVLRGLAPASRSRPSSVAKEYGGQGPPSSTPRRRGAPPRSPLERSPRTRRCCVDVHEVGAVQDHRARVAGEPRVLRGQPAARDGGRASAACSSSASRAASPSRLSVRAAAALLRAAGRPRPPSGRLGRGAGAARRSGRAPRRTPSRSTRCGPRPGPATCSSAVVPLVEPSRARRRRRGRSWPAAAAPSGAAARPPARRRRGRAPPPPARRGPRGCARSPSSPNSARSTSLTTAARPRCSTTSSGRRQPGTPASACGVEAAADGVQVAAGSATRRTCVGRPRPARPSSRLPAPAPRCARAAGGSRRPGPARWCVSIGSLRHQSMPISWALSTETISSRILMVSSSMSSRFTRMSPAMMMPLSSTRSRMSARLAGCGA